ncbi:leucine-rich repeat-containing protein 4 [Colossoma macropomum]|uniref:leucine-rich repeat-containing protein 4 n=1 Tax=Colossoma macropomum TaxID=42526 RepID=UPI001863A88E|nr:leucine-rich repeat-containing protein 4 [Colossoma macropomum]
MSLLGRVAVRRARKAALLCVVFLMVQVSVEVAAGAAGPQGCPPVCSCSNQLSKVVCTRRGLTRVPPGIPTNTRHLNLMENSIEAVQADSFRHLHHLEVLQLGRNAIRQIEVGAFNGLTSLNTLELFDNRLTVVPSGAFEYLSKLRELWLRNNPIESIPSYAFNRVPSLMRLDLGELRKLEYISDGAFEGLVNLKYLNLGMCNIRGEMPNLNPLLALEELEISENFFPEIKPSSFKGLTSLKKLWIMNSKIGLIERNAFDDLTSLVELNLAHNNLSSLPHDLFAPLKYLVELHLHHNPWNCGCDSLWLARWLRDYIPTNSTCCGRCHSPAHMRGRQLVEVDRGDTGAMQCSAPFIADAPRDLNISAERVAELRCRTAAMSSVRWLLPNGTILTHASSHPRITVLNDGTLNFSNVLVGDTGMYTCMVSNAAGKSNASAYLNVSAAELNTSNLSYFTTVTVEVLGPTSELPKTKTTTTTAGASTTTTASPSVFQPVFISTPTVLLQSTELPPSRPSAVPASKATTGKPPNPASTSLDEVMKTTKIIIGCFVAVTLLAAVMLIVFYKLRKRHQQRSTVAAARTVEIIQVDEEDLPPPASAASIPGEGALTLPEIRDHNSIHKLDYINHKSDYSYHKPKTDYSTHKPKSDYSIHKPKPDFSTYKPKSDYSIQIPKTDYITHKPKSDYNTYKPTMDYSPHKPSSDYTHRSLPDYHIHKKPDQSPYKPGYSTHKPDYKSQTVKPDFSPFKLDYSIHKPKTDYSMHKPKTDYTPHKAATNYSPFKMDCSPFKPDYSAFKADYSPLKAEYISHKPDYSPHKPKVDYSPHKEDYSPHKLDYSTLKPKYNTYKPGGHGAKWTETNSIGNSLPRTLPSTITTISEPFVIKTHAKEKVQETQI